MVRARRGPSTPGSVDGHLGKLYWGLGVLKPCPSHSGGEMIWALQTPPTLAGGVQVRGDVPLPEAPKMQRCV